MNKFIISFLSCIMLAMVLSPKTSAQISYVGDRLTIGEGTTSYYYYDIIANSKGVSLQGPKGCFFRIDLSQNMPPMISGYGNTVILYSPITGNYSSLITQQVYTIVNSAQTNTRNFNSGIDIIKRLRPISYSTTTTRYNAMPNNQYGGRNEEVGISVDELEDILPNLVYTDDNGQKLIDYTSLIPILVDAVQTLQQEVESLKSKLNNN